MSDVTPEAFLERYAKTAGVPARQLLEDGYVVATCHCDYKDCEGRQRARPENLLPWHGELIAITAHNYKETK